MSCMSDKKPKHPETPQVQKLRELVEQSGGPAAFAKKYSRDPDQPIDPTYVSQILNGHRAFRDVARKNMAIRAGLDQEHFEVKLGEYGANRKTSSLSAHEYGSPGPLTKDEIDLVLGYRNAPEAIKIATLDHMRLYAKTDAAAA